MKYKGNKLEGAAEEIVVIPRQNGDIVFTIRAILDYDECDKLDPRPIPPTRILPGNRQQLNVDDTKYKEALDKWATNRTLYMVIKSLEATKDLEWEQVEISNPETWKFVDEEFKEAGFTAAESAYLIRKVMEVNGLNENKIKDATESFLAGQAEELSAKLYQSTEQNGTPSGDPVSG